MQENAAPCEGDSLEERKSANREEEKTPKENEQDPEIPIDPKRAGGAITT